MRYRHASIFAIKERMKHKTKPTKQQLRFHPGTTGYSSLVASLSQLFIIAATMALSSQVANAAASASDTAANYTSYWGASPLPANGGNGFGPWNISVANDNNPPYVGTYLNSGGSVATGGYSFGTYANSPQGSTYGSINLYRPFTVNPTGYQDPSGLGTLYNQTFSIALASDGVGDGNGGPSDSAFGFSLDSGQGPSATPVLTLEYLGTSASDNLVLIDNDGTDNTTVPVNFGDLNGGISVSVSVGGNNPDGVNPYTITISPFAGGPAYYSYSGDTTGPIQQADVFDSNTTGNGYFNDLAISPEAAPDSSSSFVLLGLGVMGLVLQRRK
jgi:hypothetical protein